MKNGRWLLTVVALAMTACGTQQHDDNAPVRVGLIAKSLGSGFFDAVHKGADDAAQVLGAKIIFTGPTTPSAEGQIEVINALIAQRVDVIAISATDPDALVPALRRAMQRGIKVMSYDSAVGASGRIVHLAPSSDALIGATCAELAAELAPGGQGKVAVMSSTPTATNQNAWLAQTKQALLRYPGLQLTDVVYGDDVSDKSYRETVALVKRNPDLVVIVSLSSVGIVAAAKAIEDQGLTGKVRVTGLGLPSELISYVQKGVVPKFAIWNPIDLGYATTQIAVRLARGADANHGQSISIEPLGAVVFDGDGIGSMGKPSIYDAANIGQFAKLF